MGRWIIPALALVAALTGGPSGAASYSSLVFFGDSLTDTGNTHSASFGLVPPSPLYYDGNFSNGPVWSAQLADIYTDRGKYSKNYAWGGAKARTDRDFALDFSAQAALFRQDDPDRLGSRPLATIWIGANDILGLYRMSEARSTGRSAAKKLGRVAASLASSGVNDLFIANLPDLGKLPKYATNPDRAAVATAGARAFNTRLKREIEALRESGMRVRKLNTYGLFEEMFADPFAFGLTDVLTPCLDDDNNPCTAQEAQDRAFYDTVHPNAVVHSRLAEAALARLAGASYVPPYSLAAAMPAPLAALAGQSAAGLRADPAYAAAPPPEATIAPVPLPAPVALLVAGLVGLGLITRRPGATLRSRLHRQSPPFGGLQSSPAALPSASL